MRKLIRTNDGNNHIDGTDKADTIYAEGGNDRIGGHRGNDTIYGGSGKDRIGGGEDHDVLFGGTEADSLIFRSYAAKDSDTIKDFKHGSDVVLLDNHVFEEIERGFLSEDEFVLGTAARDKDDHIIYDKSTGSLYFDDDGKGGHEQHLLAVLENQAKLTASDILIAST